MAMKLSAPFQCEKRPVWKENSITRSSAPPLAGPFLPFYQDLKANGTSRDALR